MTVLQECGLSDDIVQALKRRGLRIPVKQEPFAEAMKSPSEDWVVYSFDEFAPPLTDEETLHYVQYPEDFCRDLLSNLALFSDVCKALYNVSPSIGGLADVDAVAGCLAILRVFQGAMDYHYYKYDRHIEFYEHEGSPVGFHWQRLLRLCSEASQRAGIKDELWCQKRLLRILSEIGRGNMAMQFLLSCQSLLTELEKVVGGLSGDDPNTILEVVKQKDKSLFDRLISESEIQKAAVDLVSDCLELSESAKTLKRLAAIDRRLVEPDVRDVTDHLRPDEARDFTKSVRAMELFQSVQEEETYRFYGVMPGSRAGNLEVGFTTWAHIAGILDEHPELIIAEHRESLMSIMHGSNPVLETRHLLYKGEHYLKEVVQKRYFEEINRWISST